MTLVDQAGSLGFLRMAFVRTALLILLLLLGWTALRHQGLAHGPVPVSVSTDIGAG